MIPIGRNALVRSDNSQNLSPRSRLKDLASSAPDSFGFIVDENRFPFAEELPRSLKNSLDHWKETSGKEKSWEECFKEIRLHLEEQKERFRPIIKEDQENILKNPYNVKHSLVLLAQSIRTSKTAEKAGIFFKKEENGCGDALKCLQGREFIAVLKSVNGDPGGIDNPKRIIYPQPHNFAKPCHNYQSSQKEAFAFDLATALGVRQAIPPTILTLTENENFYSFYDSPSIKKFFTENPDCEVIIKNKLGEPSPERLCSLQKAVKQASTLDLYDPMLGEVKQESFEDAMLITQVLGETDGHKKNFLMHVKNSEIHIVKIDSGFSFPRKNAGSLNALILLPNALEPLSKRYKEKVLSIRFGTIKTLAERYHFNQKCIDAAKERIEFMKQLIRTIPDTTYYEFELRLRMFYGYSLENEIRNELGLHRTATITKQNRIDFALGIYKQETLRMHELIAFPELKNLPEEYASTAAEPDDHEESYIFLMDEDIKSFN